VQQRCEDGTEASRQPARASTHDPGSWADRLLQGKYEMRGKLRGDTIAEF